MGSQVDLTSNVDVTVALLNDPWAWKVRVVEQIDVDSPESARRRRSIQCAALRPVIADAAGLAPVDGGKGPDEALVVVPIAPIPKGPLLEFDLQGPGGSQAFLVQRADIATREAAFVARAAREVGCAVPASVLPMVEAALGFTGAHWSHYRPDLREYLADGLGAAFDAAAAAECVTLARRAAEILEPFTEAPAPLDSPIENAALVVPNLVAAGTLSLEHVLATLAEYVEWVGALGTLAASRREPAADARILLESLVDYGHHYDLMAIVAVPLDEPFLIKVADRRPLALSPFVNEGEQSLVIADARSNHVALRVTDPNFRLARVRARSSAGDDDAYGTFTSRESPQVHAFYAFEGDRDYRIVLSFRVALLRRLQLVPYTLTLVLLAAAWAVVVLRPPPSDLALIVGPATFAASVLLSREPSALGSRLRVVTTVTVTVATALLALAAGFALWAHRP